MNVPPMASSPADNLHADAQSPAIQLDALRTLLLNVAEAICSGDAPRVMAASAQLTALVVNLTPAWGELFPDGKHTAAMESEQQRLRVLLPMLEARALCLAALRRWRRSLRLRRSLLDMQTEVPACAGDELSRWC